MTGPTAGKVRMESVAMFFFGPLHMDTPWRSVKFYIYQHCADTGFGLEDLPNAMTNRNVWRKRERERGGGEINRKRKRKRKRYNERERVKESMLLAHLDDDDDDANMKKIKRKRNCVKILFE